MTTTIPPVTDCPTWCRLPAGHPWTDRDSDDAFRTHRVMFGEHVRVEQDETIYGAGHAWIHADAVIDEEGSPAVVEQYAQQLRAASLRLRAILAGAAR